MVTETGMGKLQRERVRVRERPSQPGSFYILEQLIGLHVLNVVLNINMAFIKMHNIHCELFLKCVVQLDCSKYLILNNSSICESNLFKMV